LKLVILSLEALDFLCLLDILLLLVFEPSDLMHIFHLHLPEPHTCPQLLALILGQFIDNLLVHLSIFFNFLVFLEKVALVLLLLVYFDELSGFEFLGLLLELLL
jgi:hypothetical protein